MKLAQVVLTALALPGFVILPAVGLDYMGYEGAIPTPCLRECPHYYLAEVLRENPDNPKPSTPATPIAPNFIITAGHRANLLAPDPGFPFRRVLIDGELYYMVDRRPPHKVNDYYDLSIYRIEKLNGEPANLTHWVALYDHDDEIGKEITIPSFGYQGYVGAPEQGLHWGKNVLRTASTILAFGRDEIGEKDYITYEAFGISQDSGSAWLIKDGPEWKISGYFTSGSGGPRLSIHHQWIDNAIEEMGGTRPAPTITCDTTWQGTTGDWMNPANWNPSLPTATDLVKIDSNPTAIISNGSAEANEFVVGMDSSADISQTGGTANVGEGIYIGTHTGSIGTYTMTGGILNIGRTDFKGRLIVGLHGTGTLNVDSTDAQINVDELIVGSDGTGTLNINDPGAQINLRYLTFGKSSNLNPVPGSKINIALDEKCSIYGGQFIILPEADPNNLDLSNLTLNCSFKDGTIYDDDLMVRIEAAGIEPDTLSLGDFSQANFLLDKLVVGRDVGDINPDAGRVIVKLVNNWKNQDISKLTEALYVNTLEIKAGATFVIYDSIRKLPYNLYYLNGGDPKKLIIGDMNLDGVVDCSEVASLISNIGVITSGATWSDGDLDGDRDVDAEDLAMLMLANDMTDCNNNVMPDQCEYSEARLYVDTDAAGTNTGKDWINALTDLQTALCLAANLETVQEVWVAEGTYLPTSDGNREKTFRLVNQVKIYGGFAGNENSLAERDWVTNPTILSGDIGIAGNNSDNSYHVVTNDNNAEGHLDGFTITSGYAIHEKFFYGGGIYIAFGNPTLVNCRIIGNTALEQGGGIYAQYSSSPMLINCLIVGNSANQGAGIYMSNRSINMILINCTISGNTAASNAGGIFGITTPPGYDDDIGGGDGGIIIGPGLSSSLQIINCIIWGNRDSTGTGEPAQITNWFNTSVTHSCIQDFRAPGFNDNIDSNPLFARVPNDGGDGWGNANDDYGNLQLRADSPCIDIGNNAEVPAETTTDLNRNLRIINGNGDSTATVDMGAYEFNPAPDDDNDGILNGEDNCPYTPNPNQEDSDGDGWGDDCDPCPGYADNDQDTDGLCGNLDNCPYTFNPDQTDTDSDNQGDICDCDDGIDGDGNGQVDADSDGLEDECDNCPVTANPDQIDTDGDGWGDLCDVPCDLDHDGAIDDNDLDVFMNAFGRSYGSVKYNPEADMNGDGTIDFVDYQLWLLCYNAAPGDFDRDGDVDQEDFGHLQKCYTGSGNAITDPHCLDASLDGDDDVDQNDFLIFELCISGANVPADPNCAN